MTAREARHLTASRRARSVLRRWVKPKAGSLRRAEDLGDFARSSPRRDGAGRCVYEALAAGVLALQGERLAGEGVIVTPDFGRLTGPARGERTHVVRVATVDAAATLQRLEERFAGARLDWVVVDR